MALPCVRYVASSVAKRWQKLILSRQLQIWVPPTPPDRLPDAVKGAVTKVTRGVGFSVAYSDSSPLLWFWGEDPPIGGGRRGSQLGEVALPRDLVVEQVAVGRRHVAVLATTGEVFAMGLNCFGQCGLPLSPSSSSPDQLFPLLPLHLPTPIVKVCCGLDHTHFLSQNGLLYSCGWSDDGQTGTGCRGSVATPTRVMSDVMAERVMDVQCCADSALATTEPSHTIYGWGNNEYRQLPIKSSEMQVFEPWKVSPLPDQSDAGRVVATTIGSSFSAVLTRRGDIYVSGRLGGREGGGGGWSLLHHSRSGEEGEEEVVEVKAGLHYLAALVRPREGKGQQRLLLWGRHSTSLPLSHPTELELPSSLLSWDAGPLDLCLLLE